MTSDRWVDIISYLQDRTSRNSVWSNIERILVGAVAYFIWHERNLRMFKRGSRSVDQVFKIVYEVVRLKIMSFKLKINFRTIAALKTWNVGVSELGET